MNGKDLINMVIKSLESVQKPYREPYEDRFYERIICYEFYHQFRLFMKEESPFVLHGELYKGYRNVKAAPDFVFHVPGTDRKNLVVIQFKSVRNLFRRIIDDLKKLSGFQSEPFYYQSGILVIFGKGDKLLHIYQRLLKVRGSYNANLIILAYDVEQGKVVEPTQDIDANR